MIALLLEGLQRSSMCRSGIRCAMHTCKNVCCTDKKGTGVGIQDCHDTCQSVMCITRMHLERFYAGG